MRRIIVTLAFLSGTLAASAQELEPRAYSVSPVGVNFVNLAFARAAGDISFDPTLPVEDANAALHTTALSYVRSVNFMGRSANVGLVAPYVWGSLQGVVNGDLLSVTRSGLGDPVLRFSVNLHGAPAMRIDEFARYQQRTNIGASVLVISPLGQYDPAAVINIGSNRWAARPEVGLSRRLGKWYLDFYLGTWIFGPNKNYRGRVRRQDPLGTAQMHLSYNFTRRLWAAFDATYYTGGRTSVGDTVNANLQHNSRVGGTVSVPIGKRQALKFSASRGAVTNIGANFTSLGVAYQFFWGGGL